MASLPPPDGRDDEREFAMLIGGHSIIYSKNAEADRVFLRDVLRLPNVDVGEGWLIFGLPPAEVAVHPSESNDGHEFYLMCDDVQAFVAQMGAHRIACTPVRDQGYGIFTEVTLPGGGKLGVYQPRHARPKAMPAGNGTRRPAPRSGGGRSRKAARKSPKKGARRR
ncbi:MAG TPA: extradiol dioxygenase [Planctomycetota bacterium]|nr:extradiol dioxygenase [Planctomycetota bacterium]